MRLAGRSLSIMLEQHQADPRFKILDLSRNFGHQAAITAGLMQASGDVVVFMDGDLQDPPEVIPDLLEAWRRGSQIVRAQRRSRKESSEGLGLTRFTESSSGSVTSRFRRKQAFLAWSASRPCMS